MSRRKRRPATGKGNPMPRAAALPPTSSPNPPRPRKWFLAATILLQAAWIVFLIVMALRGVARF